MDKLSIFFVPIVIYRKLLEKDGDIFKHIDENTPLVGVAQKSSMSKQVDDLYLRLCDTVSPIEIDIMLKFNNTVCECIGGYTSGSLLTEVFNRRLTSIDYNQLVLSDYAGSDTGLTYKYCDNILIVGSGWDALSHENISTIVNKLTCVIGAMYGERRVLAQPFYESLVKKRA